jgi:6-phosphogluconolactonase (cycloisomerase 2 family)
MRLLMRAPACFIALAAILTLGISGVASAHGGHSGNGGHGGRVIGHLYVNENTSPVNTVAAFDRHADGSLTPVPGSPFATGGGGTGSAIGSQGALQLTDHGRYLLAVDAGSNQISVLAVRRDGSLTEIPGGTVSSGGNEPVSVTEHRHLVYVANAGVGGSNYTGFVLGWRGHLFPLPGSTVALPDGAQPGDVLFNGPGTKLVGTRVATSQIDSFAVDYRGHLRAAPGSPYPAQGPGPFGSEFRPTNPDQLFVSNAHGGADAGTVSAFHVGHDGSLFSIGASPFPDQQTAPCWVEITHDGRYLFTVNTAVPSISSYAIGWDGTLQLLGSTPFQGSSTTTLSPEDARLSPDGSTLWVVDSKGDAVSGFQVHGGQLQELTGSPTPLPAGAAPFGVVVN